MKILDEKYSPQIKALKKETQDLKMENKRLNEENTRLNEEIKRLKKQIEQGRFTTIPSVLRDRSEDMGDQSIQSASGLSLDQSGLDLRKGNKSTNGGSIDDFRLTEDTEKMDPDTDSEISGLFTTEALVKDSVYHIPEISYREDMDLTVEDGKGPATITSLNHYALGDKDQTVVYVVVRCKSTVEALSFRFTNIFKKTSSSKFTSDFVYCTIL